MPKSTGTDPGSSKNPLFSSINEAIGDIREGQIVLLVDDEDRENEGDFVMAAEKVTPEAINFMTKEGRGLVCLSLTPERVESLGLPMMVDRFHNGSPFGTPFTVSIEAREGVTTGISAFDRAHTIRTAIQPHAASSDLVTPGHIFPLRARPGGVLRRAGHTEGAVDLAQLAGLDPSGVICEVMREDGTMARLPDLEKVAERNNLSIVTIKDLIAYRMQNERLIEPAEEVTLPTPYGDFRAVVYRNRTSGRLHFALVMGDVNTEEPVLIRVHPALGIMDFFNLLRSDCTDRLRYALRAIQKEGRGVLVYLRSDTMGDGGARLDEKKTEAAQEVLPRVGPISRLREYGIGAQILVDLGVKRIRIMTNDERRLVALEGYGLHLEERVPLETEEPLVSILNTGPK
ncbi:MAG: 3,4-dihydroxy-2-butanone-4-phosphate synthase [Nitrospinota bacterium]